MATGNNRIILALPTAAVVAGREGIPRVVAVGQVVPEYGARA